VEFSVHTNLNKGEIVTAWIDFKALRAKLDFEQLLRDYGVDVKRKGDQHHGFCPLPNHQGKKNSASFSANLTRGIFQCFGCGAKGNVLEFAALMEGVDPHNSTAFRNVALGLQERLCPEPGATGKPGKHPKEPQPVKPSATPEFAALVNAPLDFELKGLQSGHPYLAARGFTPETIAHFGLGFCSRGMLKDRVAIPLHDHQGRLVGYAGRLIDDAKVSEDNPRYRFPGKRERDGKVFEFRKTRFLYNGFRINAPVDDLVVVEGFTSVWWMNQCGRPNVVGTMGSDCSERQAELIISLVKPAGRVWFVPDGDTAGERFAQSLLLQVSPYRFVRWVKMEKDRQPTDLSAEQLGACFSV
jgi:DNA primase